MLSPLEGYENKLQVYKHIFLYSEKMWEFLLLQKLQYPITGISIFITLIFLQNSEHRSFILPVLPDLLGFRLISACADLLEVVV